MLKFIASRTSVRDYAEKPIEREKLDDILQAAVLAPSAKNCQPWRFVVVQKDKELLHDISDLVRRSTFVRTADCLVCVFLDKDNGFEYVKDCQTMGACIENMLLAASSLGIGACWIGEILEKQIELKNILRLPVERYDLMAVVSLGYPQKAVAVRTPRIPLEECVLAYK